MNLVPRSGRVVIWGDTEESGPALRRAAAEGVLPGGDLWLFRRRTIGWRREVAPTMRWHAISRDPQWAAVRRICAGRHRTAQRVERAGGHGSGARTRDIRAKHLAKALGDVSQREAPHGCERRSSAACWWWTILRIILRRCARPSKPRAAAGPSRRLWAILEPRSNSMRRKVFQETLPQALALADRVVLGGVFRAQQLGDENRLESGDRGSKACERLGKEARVSGRPRSHRRICRWRSQARRPVADDVQRQLRRLVREACEETGECCCSAV